MNPVRDSIIAEGWAQIAEGRIPCQPMPAPHWLDSFGTYTSGLLYWMQLPCQKTSSYNLWSNWEVWWKSRGI